MRLALESGCIELVFLPLSHTHGACISTGTPLASSHLLLVVIVVGAGQKVAEDELWDVDLLHLVDGDRDAIAVVPHLDEVGLLRGGRRTEIKREGRG